MRTLFPTISPPRLRGQLVPSAAPSVTVTPGLETRALSAHIARSIRLSPGARGGPFASGSPLDDLQRSIAALIKGAAPAPGLYTHDGDAIHLDADASAPEHHAMSAAGHREAGEVLRQAAKLLFHLRDVKREGGDRKGALLFDREARQALARLDGHAQVASHKANMDRHAANAAEHGTRAAGLAREITGDKDHVGIQDHARARTHARFPEYVAERHAELRSSEGVRHAALGAMGREGGGAHPVELNRFLGLHGHDRHGLSEEADGGELPYQAGKARLDKSLSPARRVLTAAFIAATLRRSTDFAKTITGAPSLRPVKQTRLAAMASRGGRARNAGRAQERIPGPTAPDRLQRSIAALRKSADPATSHMQLANDAAEEGDAEAALLHALCAMEHALAAEPARGSDVARAPAAPGSQNASRDGDGDGRTDGPDDGDSDGDPGDPPAKPELIKAVERRPLRPSLELINHRPQLRVPSDRPDVAQRVFRRWADGSLDFEGALHTVLGVLWKWRDGAELTPLERAIASVILPADEALMPAALADLTVRQLTPEEKHLLAARVLGHFAQIARADAQRTLARSASAIALDEVREHLPSLLVRDPFRLGTARFTKAYAPVEIGGARPTPGGPGSRGGKVAYTTKTGRPVYASHARRLAPHMDRAMTHWHQRADSSNDPEHHASAAKQALAAAFYHHHAEDPIAAEQAIDYADHHYEKAKALGHAGRTMRWIEQHRPAMQSLLE